jgi:cytochrome c oxidase subunit 2
VLPTLFLIYIFFQGFFGYMDKVVSPGNAIEMRLTGYKWNWTLVYPNGAETFVSTKIGAKPINVFYMPAETPVRLRMNSSDVMHAFWIPDFRIKQDLLPNRYTNIWFKAKRPGADAKTLPKTKEEADARGEVWIEALAGAPYTDHWVFCAEYCGDEHAEMAAIIRVVEDQHWRAFLEIAAEGGGETDPVKIGQRIAQQKCASCHSVDGSKNTGPTWKDLYNKPGHRTNKGEVPVNPDYIRESILVPAAQIVEGYPNNMPAFVLKDKQIEAIIAYMKTLSTHTPPGEMPGVPGAAPAEGASPGASEGAAPATPAPAGEAPKPQG